MRKAYLVTYDHEGPAKEYSDLFNELKNFPRWWHYINNTWIVLSEADAKGIYEKLKPHLDEKINLLVIEVGKDRAGWLPKKAWAWIRTNLAKSSDLRPCS